MYCNGTEFKLASNGQIFRGYYHIHPEKGPMEGRQHEERPHEFLIPISGSNRIINKKEPTSNNYRNSQRISGNY